MGNKQFAEEAVIECVSQIPEVVSVYKHDDPNGIIFIALIGGLVYQWDIHTQIYKHEHDLHQQFPDVDLCICCIPELWVDDCFSDAPTPIYQRVGS